MVRVKGLILVTKGRASRDARRRQIDFDLQDFKQK